MRAPGGLRSLVFCLCAASCGASGPQSHPASVSPISGARTSPFPPAADLGAQRFADASPAEVFKDPERRNKLATAFPKIDAMLAEELAKQSLPGVAVGVIIDGELAHASSAGVRDLDTKTPIDVDTIFRIGSITKTFTATALLGLRDAGKLSLDDPAARYLPELSGVVYPTRDAPPMTLRQLLTHSSGLPRGVRSDAEEVTEELLMKSLSGLSLEYVPGTRYTYSNLGFGLLGLVVQRVANAPYRDYMKRTLLEPLGMRSTGFDASSVPADHLATGYERDGKTLKRATPWRLGALEGAGAMYSSVRDMARYLAFQLDAYPARSAAETGPVRRSSVRESHILSRARSLHVSARPDSAKGQPAVNATSSGVGLAWHGEETCEFDRILEHNGAVDGFQSSVEFLPYHGVALVALSNERGAETDRIVRRARHLLAGTGGLHERVMDRKASPLLERALAAYLEVQNRWDEKAYSEMLTEGHKKQVKTEVEREEMAGYLRRHGACRSGPAAEVFEPLRARFALACERGRLELSLGIDEQGKIRGFTGESYDLQVSAGLVATAERIAGLIGKWSDETYNRHLAPEFAMPKGEVSDFFDGVRADHRACKLAKPLASDPDETQAFQLSCEAGGDLKLSIRVAKKSAEHVVVLSIRPLGDSSKCPLR